MLGGTWPPLCLLTGELAAATLLPSELRRLGRLQDVGLCSGKSDTSTLMSWASLVGELTGYVTRASPLETPLWLAPDIGFLTGQL